jgi:hypothetical protein
MFRCAKCRQLSQPGETATRVVLEIRDKEYPKRENAQKVGSRSTRRYISDEGGFGHEIVKEALFHTKCAQPVQL